MTTNPDPNVKAALPRPEGEQTRWTVLLTCGHTLTDVVRPRGQRPRHVPCGLPHEEDAS